MKSYESMMFDKRVGSNPLFRCVSPLSKFPSSNFESLLQHFCFRPVACFCRHSHLKPSARSREQGFAHMNFDLQRTGEDSETCFLLPQNTGDSGSMSPSISFFAEGNGNSAVSSTPAQHVPSNADLSLSIVPCTSLDVAEFANIARSCMPSTTLPASGSRLIPATTGPSQCAFPIESLSPYSQQDDTNMARPGSCNQFAREQEFIFSAPLHSVRHKVKKKQERRGFLLPDSFARSFDASEMDKIAQTIVRVNRYGSSNTENGVHKSGHTMPRVLPSVGAFTVQCANCFKWRLIPSKEQYEQIRQNVLEKPFFCTSWRPGASCDDPPELSEDSKLLWAIDKPNIPLPPDGWERLVVIRGEGCSKFADIYYVSPFGKKLRSMPEVERYLLENPELVNGGASLSQFSFASPRSLDENYCRKRPTTVMRGSISMISTNNSGVGQPQGEQRFVSFIENAPIAVEPLRAWDPNSHALMICHHPELEGSGNI
ncbi:hypothetical protein GOP47_0004314 [Adiantum capillus-veneris]|uniref:Uncharacterized protein n=1 Tax=Adiantum capillus-veneris TaxID=13818 RepID=A0A9D4ZPL5_ADICA|nr:hypothetical protein GOP47_0004314 [Adiantum capillus-veneris]